MKTQGGISLKFKIILLKTCLLLTVLICGSFLFAQETIVVSNQKLPLSIGKSVALLYDNQKLYDSSNIVFQKDFAMSNESAPVLSLPSNNVWIRFKIKNISNNPDLHVSVNYADIANISLYEKDSLNKLHLFVRTGNAFDYSKREDNSVTYNFNLNLPNNSEKTYFLHVNSPHPYEIPIFINDSPSISSVSYKENLIIGFYCGILISTLLYNLFIYFATRDKNYLIYVCYLFALCFAQISLAGWSFKFFWPHHPQINSFIVICTSCIAGFFTILFSKYFLDTKRNTPGLDKLLSVLLISYSIATILSFTNYAGISYIAFNILGLTQAVVLLYTSVVIYKKGNSSALFYLIAWSLLLLGLIVYLLKNLNILPQNEFTHFVLYIGTSIEAVLLSFALANKINILRNEKEQSQLEALRIAKENERLILEQNVMLERKVNERTLDLQATNEKLISTLNELKDAQIQLVESEKMASLGQLTAGIAHEINNPINFVKSNVKPLQMDVRDLFELITRYQKLHTVVEKKEFPLLNEIKSFEEEIDPEFIKEEIQNLIGGIEEGAERTAEIVRSLRNFSRLDESEKKVANVHEGIDSTLVLLKNTIPDYLKIIKQFDASGDIECYPSKLNQVFMNIITNAIQAIKEKENIGDESIVISTRTVHEYMEISIKDSGIGMTEEVKHKIFDPFFTTKEVGEGTGLGMSITFKIIEKHQGKIAVFSAPGCGTEIIISIPYQQANTN
jgi:two-component system NtrC family sensor kinase